MAGLQELLMLRELQDQANPVKSAFQSFAQGISQGIETARQEQKQRRVVQENIDKLMGDRPNTDKFKMDESIDLETGKISRTLKRKSQADIKTDLEIDKLRRELNAPSIYDSLQPAISESSGINTGSITMSLSADQQQGTVIPREQPSVTGSLVIPSYEGKTGIPKEVVDIGAQTAIKRAESDVSVEGQVKSQAQKAADLAERDFRRASAAVDTAFDQVLSFDELNFNKYGVKPGDYLGLFAKLQPQQLNAYKAAAVGAGKESAALIARQIIPGVRGANITNIFARSSAEIGNTQEGNAANVSASMGNAFANALSQNIKVYDENTGKEVNLLDVTIDKQTGKPLSKLSILDQARAINDLKREFAEKLNSDYIMRVYRKNQNLLQPETVNRIRAIESQGLNPAEWSIIEEQ